VREEILNHYFIRYLGKARYQWKYPSHQNNYRINEIASSTVRSNTDLFLKGKRKRHGRCVVLFHLSALCCKESRCPP
jgi:hypothetical protein